MPRNRVPFAWVIGVFVLSSSGGCGGRVPLPVFPQLQEVGEIGEYGTRRVRASEACRQSTNSVETFVACMEARGWTFIARDNIYPAPECWSLRTAGDPRQLPTSQCFHETAAPRPAPSAPATGAP